ncbi:hypothetical protein JCM10212_003308 [Sporobolomyces blumeae]
MDPTPPLEGNGHAPARPAFEITTVSREVISVDLDEMFNAPTDDDTIAQLSDLVQMMAQEHAPVHLWCRLVHECWTRNRFATAIYYADQGLASFAHRPTDQVPLLCLKANYHLALARKAPKTRFPDPRTGPLAVPKDKHHPESLYAQHEFPRLAERDRSDVPMTKDQYWFRVGKDLDRAAAIEPDNRVVRDLRAALLVARGRFEEANRLFETILQDEPNHLMALTGRARILFSRLAFRPALKLYQQVLSIEPTFLPDPRIGIGLCFWFLGDREKARKAWERSIAVNPNNSTSATTLLGLLHLNRSRDPLLPGSSAARTKAYELGIGLVQQAFKKDNTLAAAMGPLGNHLLIQNQGGVGVQQALKLFERSLQFSETRLLIAESHFNLARALDADPDGLNTAAALNEYQNAVQANPDLVIAHLGAGACYVRTEQFPAAINAYETLLRKHPTTVEALVSLASIHTHLCFTFHSVSDSSASRKLAKESYEAVLRIFNKGRGNKGDQDSTGRGGGGGGGSAGDDLTTSLEISKSERIRQLARDGDMWIEMARLWSDEATVDRSLKAWQEARRIMVDKALDELDPAQVETDEQYEAEVERIERTVVDPRIRNNVGVLLYNKKSFQVAKDHLEMAFEAIGKRFAERGAELDGGDVDATLTTVTYNLACCYEKLGLVDKAKEGWENVLRGHPEFVEAKARLALLEIASAKGRDKVALERAHVYLKEALTSQSSSLELRSLYTYFLMETFQHRQAREFARTTLKDVSKNDVYALFAMGLISYLEARENKGDTKAAEADRQQRYVRSAEAFDKALQLDPQCAVAAQGLAIALAEGNLGNVVEPASAASSNGGGGSNGANANGATPMTEAQARQKNARDALVILTKVKESVNDASVYVNIGHCHLARDEFDRAAENYTTASRRYLSDKSSTVLWYLARAWYFKALKESSFADLEKAIAVGQQATDLYPTDLSNLFNMAVLKQKAIETLYGKPTDARTSAQLRKAHEYLVASDAIFAQLQADPTQPTPYQKDYPRLRRIYGTSLLKRYDATLEQQLAYEETEAGRINQARQAREAEKARQAEIEQQKLEEQQRQAAALAEQRKKMREETDAYLEDAKQRWKYDSDDDDKKKRTGGGGKKRKTKMMEGGEDEAKSTDEEGGEKPAKKRKAKREKKEKGTTSKRKGKASGKDEDKGARSMDVDEHYDEDDEDAPIRAPGRKRKGKANNLVKSNEFIDSDDEEE